MVEGTINKSRTLYTSPLIKKELCRLNNIIPKCMNNIIMWIWSTADIFQAHHSLKSKPKLLKRLNKAIDKTLTAPQVQNLDEVRR